MSQVVRPIRAVAALSRDDLPLPVVLPLGFVGGPRPGNMVPSYPSGLPLHVAAFAALVGWERGPFLVSPVFAVLGVLAFYRLAREPGLNPRESAAGSAILALQPLSVFMGFQPMSDVVASIWATLAVLLALRARRGPSWALPAGAAFAVACLVRPSNSLRLLPLALALPLTFGVLGRSGNLLPALALVVVVSREVALAAHRRVLDIGRRFGRRLLRRSLQQGRSWYALLHELEAREVEDRDLGRWRRIGAVANVELLELEPESLLGALR